MAQKIIAAVIVIAMIGGALAFLRINNITSLTALWDYLQDTSKSASTAADNSGISNRLKNPCNVVKDATCLYSSDGKTSGESNDGASGSTNDGSADGSAGSSADSSGSNLMKTTRANQLSVAVASSDSYKASEWPHWTMISGSCDAREIVLKNAGASVDSTCRPTGGSVKDALTGSTVSASDATVDYVIPLDYVVKHGGASWGADVKRSYANDMSGLMALSSGTADRRGSKGPNAWMPSDKTMGCSYADEWVTVALKWNITVTQRDKQALRDTLLSCS